MLVAETKLWKREKRKRREGVKDEIMFMAGDQCI